MGGVEGCRAKERAVRIITASIPPSVMGGFFLFLIYGPFAQRVSMSDEYS